MNIVTAILKKTLLVLFSLLFTFAVLEIGVRILAPGSLHDQNFRKYDPKIGYTLTPNLDTVIDAGNGPHHLVTNEYGFIGTSFPLKKPENEWRIAHFGDSFTEGDQEVDWNKNYVALLKEWLAKNTPVPARAYESLNFGVSGRGTIEEYWSYKYFGYETNPDLAVLWFTLNNDFANNYLPDQAPTALATNTYGKIKYFLKKSALFSLVFERLKGNIGVIKFLQRIHLTNANSAYQGNTNDGAAFAEKLNYSTDPADTPAQSVAYGITENTLVRFDEAVRQNGGKFLVVIIPDGFVTENDYAKAFFTRYPKADAEKYDFGKATRVLSEMLAKHHIAYLDLAPEFHAYAEGHSAIPDCGKIFGNHFTACGHRVTADIVGRYIQEHFLGK